MPSGGDTIDDKRFDAKTFLFSGLDMCTPLSCLVVYLHCWGGHGRAGTVVCLLLHLLYGLDAAEAMMRCQFVHDLRRVPIVVGSPQTQTQSDAAPGEALGEGRAFDVE